MNGREVEEETQTNGYVEGERAREERGLERNERRRRAGRMEVDGWRKAKRKQAHVQMD